jgi:hypothetical protein
VNLRSIESICNHDRRRHSFRVRIRLPIQHHRQRKRLRGTSGNFRGTSEGNFRGRGALRDVVRHPHRNSPRESAHLLIQWAWSNRFLTSYHISPSPKPPEAPHFVPYLSVTEAPDEGPMGHEMLYAYDTNNGNSAFHSFGPESHGAVARLEELLDIPMSGKNGYGLGNIKSPDDLRQQYASFTIQLNPEDTQKAIQFIKDLKAVNYLTYARNCTSTCADILRKLKLHQLGEIVPQALFYNFAREHGNENVPYPAQHGTDYGQPRAGHDPFQLLFLTIQHCHAETASWAENGKPTGTTTTTVCN